MLANYHTHTERCHHATGSDREYIENAIRGGMRVLGFSDHCPWIFPDGHVSGTRMLPSKLDDYFSSLTALKKEYERDITIYIGFEAEYVPSLMADQNKLLEGYPVDYMILGEHFIEPEPYGNYTGWPNNSSDELRRYVDLVIEGLETGKYAYVAHPDLMNHVGAEADYNEQYRRLCLYLKEHNIPVEINLLGLREKRHYPCDRFFKIAQEVGNTAIIGCDAHSPLFLSDSEDILLGRKYAESFGLKIVDFLPNLGEKASC